MIRLSPRAISGILVLMAGAAVVYTLAAGPVDVQAAPAAFSQPQPQVVEVPPPTVEGIDAAVQRVLYSSGHAQALAADQLSELPPEVARILIHYQATLTIPIEPGVPG